MHQPSPAPAIQVYLLGNPNSGKTSLFNRLTGERRKVGNWPGVTVDHVVGTACFAGNTIDITDLPGTYSLQPFSPEEAVATKVLPQAEQAVVINVIDASNLERNLLLTLQLLEVGLRPIIACNFIDEVRRQSHAFDPERLAESLGCRVVVTDASRGEGIAELLRAITETAPAASTADAGDRNASEGDEPVAAGRGVTERIELKPAAHLPPETFEAVSDLSLALGHPWATARPHQRLAVLTALAGPPHLEHDLGRADCDLASRRQRLAGRLGGCPAATLTADRYRRIEEVVRACGGASGSPSRRFGDRLDTVFVHRWLGFPIFAAMMWFVFWTTFNLSRWPSEMLQEALSALHIRVGAVLPEGLLADFLTNAVIEGVGSTLVFLPAVVILFGWIAVLEDSGYMARAAFIMDRVMQSLRLQGRAFIPLMMGIGCNVPAVMATRIIDRPGQRLRTILLIPLMSCSARVPVFVFLAGIFFPANAGHVLMAIYVIGVVTAVLTGLLMGRYVDVEGGGIFMMELPPYRCPTPVSVWRLLREQVWHFVEKAGTVILSGAILMWALASFPRQVPADPGFEAEVARLHLAQDSRWQEDLSEAMLRRQAAITQRRYLAQAGRFLEPLVSPMGLTWREAVSLIPGFVAKEGIIASLGVVYGATGDRLGQAMRTAGITPLSGFAFMVVVLLYVPCLPTVGVIYRETASLGWTLVATLYPAILAWIAGLTVVYGGVWLGIGEVAGG